MTEPRRSRRPSPGFVLWASVLLFALLFGLLVSRFAAESQTKQQAAQAVQVRKVIKRRVVTTIVGGSGGETVTASPVSTSAAEPAPEPVVTSAS